MYVNCKFYIISLLFSTRECHRFCEHGLFFLVRILQYRRTVLGPSNIFKFPLCYTVIESVIFLLTRFVISFNVTGLLYSVVPYVYFVSCREVDQQKCHAVLFLSRVCFFSTFVG